MTYIYILDTLLNTGDIIFDHDTSSFGPSQRFTSNDPLIAMIVIGKYKSKSQLQWNDPSYVSKSYDSITNTFVKTRKYNIIYQTANGNMVYTNDAYESKTTIATQAMQNEHNNNYKLHWTRQDISLFVRHARKQLIDNKHDCLIFILSCYGDETKQIIYDSNDEKYQLDDVFNSYDPHCVGDKLYLFGHSHDECVNLLQIPKLFVLDICTFPIKNVVAADYGYIFPFERYWWIPHYKISSKPDTLRRRPWSNFCMIYANTEEYLVSIDGSLFLRSMCKVFNDSKFVCGNSWRKIVDKIRQIVHSKSIWLPQKVALSRLVEFRSTLEADVMFGGQD